VPPTPLVPLRVRLELSALPLAVSVALSLYPLLFGAYSMVSVQDLLGPRLLPLQRSWVIVKAEGPDSVIESLPVALPPQLVSVNVTDFVVPAASVP
jgi:hypothetical protein